MFKKPLGGLKTSAPLRSSDRRKLKQRVVTEFGISSEDGDLLVPDGILSIKFSTHLDEPGIAYLAPGGDPLWFTVGKGSADLVPSVYTLWKRRDLLPFLSTPSAVIPILVGGADLMIPGVVHHTPSLQEGQLVSILQYNHHSEEPTLSPPLAVGRMALPSDKLKAGGKEKGKAVHVLHTWKDHLWDMGSKSDAPDPILISSLSEQPSREENSEGNSDESDPSPVVPSSPPTEAISSLTLGSDGPPQTEALYTAEEITALLHTSLLQAISASIPASSFPIPSTLFYTNYILPSRPAFPTSVAPPASAAISRTQPSNTQEINIKSSTHKSLTAFLKTAEKSSILTLKSPQKHSQQSDLLVTSVNASHPSVVGHQRYITVKDMEARAAKKAQRAEAMQGGGEIEVKELWKPHQASLILFEGMGGDVTGFYTMGEVKTLLNNYISTKNLVNPHDQAYINLDPLMIACFSSKGKSKGKDVELDPAKNLEFMKRDDLIRNTLEKMQNWYEVKASGGDAVRKKGLLKPIQVVMKIRQGRKASTLITGFEPFLVVDADDMAEELRKVCAGATSVSPIPGKPAGSGVEVLVQGKQSKAVVDYLTGRGIPKKWIEVRDVSGKK